MRCTCSRRDAEIQTLQSEWIDTPNILTKERQEKRSFIPKTVREIPLRMQTGKKQGMRQYVKSQTNNTLHFGQVYSGKCSDEFVAGSHPGR